MQLLVDRIASPIGTIQLVCDGAVLRALDFSDYDDRMHRLLRSHYGDCQPRTGSAPASIREPLQAYFEGDLNALDRIAVETGGTPFQRQVWTALREIAAGTTTTYGALAKRIGKPAASRAVGMANGSNPVGIVVPCHRVIGAKGALTGYGGGLDRKAWLIAHEKQWLGLWSYSDASRKASGNEASVDVSNRRFWIFRVHSYRRAIIGSTRIARRAGK